ncbi:MAG: DNA repair protein RecO [Bacteroidota bacterium]|nr:DNA repair protein RecO [Candidatus Kapabacteria bacterium]MDW8220891.1 DNA repair protein RecO [Bacteroidota bacterium]
MIATTEAIILKSLKYRDSSKLLTAYTAEYGRCAFVAHGARRTKNKFGTALEPMSYSILRFYKRPHQELYTLSAAEIAVPMRSLLDSFDRITAGLAICDTVYTTQLHEERNPSIFELLKTSLLALNASTSNEQTLLIWFQIQYAALIGFRLRPTQCAITGEAVAATDSSSFLLSLANGAPYSPRYASAATGFPVDAGTLAVLQRLSSVEAEHACRIRLSEHQHRQLLDFLTLYYQFHLSRNFSDHSRRFIHAVQAL